MRHAVELLPLTTTQANAPDISTVQHSFHAALDALQTCASLVGIPDKLSSLCIKNARRTTGYRCASTRCKMSGHNTTVARECSTVSTQAQSVCSRPLPYIGKAIPIKEGANLSGVSQLGPMGCNDLLQLEEEPLPEAPKVP